MKFTVDQIQTAKTEQELKKSIDFYLNRNLEHAAKVSKMPKNSKQRADETAKLLNEARGIDKLGFKALQGLINEDEKFEENSKSGKYYVLDADGALVQGVNDNIGLIDALNKETVYKNLNMDTRSKIKPYVTNRMANFSKKINAIENEVTEKVKGENTTIPTDPSEQVDYIIKLQDNKINNITLSDYNKYRNKIGLKSINQNEFDITHKPGLIQQYRLGGNEGDYGSIIQVISNEIDNYVNKNAGKKDPKSIL
jgi:DNA-directed RNA polymerase subunit F